MVDSGGGGGRGRGGGSSGEGRLAQEDVEELEQQRQDHGPQRQLTAEGSVSRWPPGLLLPPFTQTHAEISLCGVTAARRSRRRGSPGGVARRGLSLMPGDAVKCHTRTGRSLRPPASWTQLISFAALPPLPRRILLPQPHKQRASLWKPVKHATIQQLRPRCN